MSKEWSMNERKSELSRKGVLLIAGAAVSVLSSGCDLIAEKLTKKATEAAVEHVIEKKTGGDVKLDTTNGTLTVKSDKGDIRINKGDGKLPGDWPQDVPVYPGAKISMSVGIENNHQLLLETTDSQDKAAEFYKSKFSSWKLEFSTGVGGSQITRYKEESTGRFVQMTIGGKSNTNPPLTIINLIVGTETKKEKKKK